MEQAQVFASAWALIGGRFDSGNALPEAEEAKAELEEMLRKRLTPPAQVADPRFGSAAMIIRDICELDQDDPNDSQTICINIDTLERIVDEHVQSESAQEPVAYLLNGARFKMSFSESGKISCFANYRAELDGRWVALVGAENDAHLYTRPDGLRKAAEEVMKWLDVPIIVDNMGDSRRSDVENLRAALEGKS